MADQDQSNEKRSATTGAPVRGENPTAADPFWGGAPPESGGEEPPPLDEREQQAVDMAKKDPKGDDGPTYERHQGLGNDDSGGSTDPHNTLSHADSGDETGNG